MNKTRGDTFTAWLASPASVSTVEVTYLRYLGRAGFVAVVRRRYVKLFDLGKERALGLVADLDGGRWAGVTFFRGNVRNLRNLRTGLRIFDE